MCRRSNQQARDLSVGFQSIHRFCDFGILGNAGSRKSCWPDGSFRSRYIYKYWFQVCRCHMHWYLKRPFSVHCLVNGRMFSGTVLRTAWIYHILSAFAGSYRSFISWFIFSYACPWDLVVRWTYMRVVCMIACPRYSWISLRLTPCSNKWVA